MDKIPITVITNKDNLKNIKWPSYVCCRPQKEDYLLSFGTGHQAKIVNVIHAQDGDGPHLIIEVGNIK